MTETVRASKHSTALEMIGKMIDAPDAFVAGAPQHDDITVMIVKIL